MTVGGFGFPYTGDGSYLLKMNLFNDVNYQIAFSVLNIYYLIPILVYIALIKTQVISKRYPYIALLAAFFGLSMCI